MLRRCEGIALEMQGLLKDSADGAIPIVIAIRTAPELNPSQPAVSPNISQLAQGGFHLQITVQARPDFNPHEFRTELIRLLVVERILRGHQSITPRGRILPDWLLVGINEALEFRSRAKPSALFAAVFRNGKVFGIEDILDVNLSNLDALSQAIYNTSCCALVLALLDQPDGPLRMGKFLNALPSDPRSNKELIAQWFPNLALSASSLDKWWSLQMANLSRPTVFETLGPAETMAALESALYFRTASSAPAPEKPAPRPSPKPKAKPKVEPEPEAPEKPEIAATEPPKSSGNLLRRLFSRDKTADPPEEKKPEEKPKPEPKKESPQPTKEDGPGLLGRWFFGDGKKNAEKDKKDQPHGKEAPSKKKDTSLIIQRAILQTVSPMMAMIAEALAPDSGQYTVRILGIGKKKTPEEIAAEEKEKEAKATEKKKAADAATAAEEQKAKEKKKADEERAKAKAEEKAKRESDKEKERAAKAESKKDKDAPPPEPEPKPKAETTKPKVPTKRTTPAPKASPPATSSTSAIPIDEFAKLTDRKDIKAVCMGTINNLAALSRRAHPLFRPVINDYIRVIEAIADGKTKEVPAALTALKAAREAALAQAKAVQDHLDWYEAAETKNYTGQFDDYLRLPDTIKKEIPPRSDAISKALDEAEKGR